jgi:tripartite-type tricarboxylate transporter receptor subunit TctC
VVASATADGYTVLYDATAHSVNPSLFARLPYDTLAAFRPVFLAAVVPNLLLVNPRNSVRTVPDVIAAARASAGGLDWASSGNGSAQHLAMELFRAMANIPVNHVPYRGGGPALNDLIANQIGYFFSNASSSIGHVRGGTLRAVAQTAQGRLAQLPDVPAVAETVPGYEALEWNGVFVPAGTPSEVVMRLNAVIATPAIAERLTSLTVQTRANTPDQFGAFVRSEMEKWGEIVRRVNIRPD